MLDDDPNRELGERLLEILMPYARSRLEAVKERRGRFVHYTSAESALKIIQSKTMWMRNTACMNDYRELQHGQKILSDLPEMKRLTETIKSLPFVGEAALKVFGDWWTDNQFGMYITSISEHDDTEDIHGRLSMWRAVSRSAARVALVVRAFEPATGWPTNLMVSPVAYFTVDQLAHELGRVTENIQSHREFLLSADPHIVYASLFYMLALAIVCLKHEGFREEREWRLIYWHRWVPVTASLTSSIEVVDGVPQLIYKIPLGGPTPGLAQLAIPSLLDRIIIGPSPYPEAMREAFTAALANAGVVNAGERVFASGIPIRM
jgi:hypothetical protein